MRDAVEKHKGLLITLGLAILSAFLFYSYQRAGSNDPDTLPLIRASEAPFKVRPDNPGGMSLAHQDNALMQIIEDRRDWDRVQMTEIEEDNFGADDQDTEQAPSTITQEAEPDKIDVGTKIEDTTETKEINETPANETAQKPERQIQFEPVLKQLTTPKPKQQATPSPTTTAAANKSKAVSTSGSHFIQLGSFRSREEAQKGYSAFEQKYGSSVNQLGVRYQTAEIEGKGTFFRVQAGPAEKSKADALCAEIKAKGGACYVVGR